jgi:hypothetical protein
VAGASETTLKSLHVRGHLRLLHRRLVCGHRLGLLLGHLIGHLLLLLLPLLFFHTLLDRG